MAAPEPVRMRPTLAAGPMDESGAQLHVKAVHERKADGTRVWGTGECEVIPQVDRIGGSIAQVSVFFNDDARVHFIGPTGDVPKLTGRVADSPNTTGWCSSRRTVAAVDSSDARRQAHRRRREA